MKNKSVTSFDINSLTADTHLPLFSVPALIHHLRGECSGDLWDELH